METFWNLSPEELLKKLNSSLSGLSQKEAKKRLITFGKNKLGAEKNGKILKIFLRQFTTPLVLLLLGAALLSSFLKAHADAAIIMAIVLASGILGFFQEKSAFNAMKKLIGLVQVKATVLRDEEAQEIPVDHVVPGDIVLLSAGDIVPADGLILESKDLFVDEATLTGETLAAEKKGGIVAKEAPLKERFSALFMATHVVSGTAKALIVETGPRTAFGAISSTIQKAPPPTAFDVGIRHFGLFLMNVTLALVGIIFAFNLYFHRPLLESFLFSLALAVGLTPQLLPAIVSINMARGARHMAKKKVIVKKLSAIENFGSMDLLACDKTGTLTKGVIELYSALDTQGASSEEIGRLAYINSSLQLGYSNPIDKAILAHKSYDITGYEKLDELPYDFTRKRLSILVRSGGENLLITKGAFHQILEVCSNTPQNLQGLFEKWSREGFRVLGIATKSGDGLEEKGMTFRGFLLFFDPPKPGVKSSLDHIKSLGIDLKMITGDNAFVTRFIASQVGLDTTRLVTGKELYEMSDEALTKIVKETSLFADVEPSQKLRLINALKRAGKTVGFLGDGINDIMAMHAADVSISVDHAIDIAKEVSDIVLMKKELSILSQGVVEGRKIFANTMKYIFMATSANFGNMFSMAGASLILNFLPMLPKQILLTNFLTDIPEMTIATDAVDHEMTERPSKWDIKFIYRFMLVFGLISSLFDYLTFGCLIFLLHASEKELRTGWLIESVLSAAFIVLFIRTRRPIYKSRPSWPLLLSTLCIILITAWLPYSPLAAVFDFVPLPVSFYLFIAAILVSYVLIVEIAKKKFYTQTTKGY